MCTPAVHDERAVDDHGLDPGRVAARLVVGRVRSDRRRVEDHDVGERAVAQGPALAQAEPGRRCRGHLAHRLLDAQQRFVADELAEDARERAVRARARLRADERGVGADHADRVRHERPKGLGPRTARDLVDREVLVEEEVADRIDRVAAGLVHHVRERARLPPEVVRVPERAEAHVGPARRARVGSASSGKLLAEAVARGPLGEALLERAGAAGLDPARELDEEPGARPLVRVGVVRDVEALGAGIVDEAEQGLVPAGMRLAVVEVRDVGRRPGSPPDLDRLPERVQVAVAERVPDVGVVERAVPARLLRQRGELLGRGVAAGRIVEPGAEPDRAFLQPFAEERRACGPARPGPRGRRPSRRPRCAAPSCRSASRR